MMTMLVIVENSTMVTRFEEKLRNVIGEGMGRLHASTTELSQNSGKGKRSCRKQPNALSQKVFRFDNNKKTRQYTRCWRLRDGGSLFSDAPQKKRRALKKGGKSCYPSCGPS